MQKKLNLYFTTADKKSYHITLNYPKDNLTKAEAEAVGQKIIATKVFNNEKRTLAEFKKASYVTTEETILQYLEGGGCGESRTFFYYGYS